MFKTIKVRNSFSFALTATSLVALTLTSVSALAGSSNLVTNGTFLNPINPGIGGSAIPGWTQTAMNTGATIRNDCVVIGGKFCSTQLWGGANAFGFATSPGTSPAGGNYFADPLRKDLGQVKISQTLTGLTVGQEYDVQFYQSAFMLNVPNALPTQANWAVTLGNTTQYSSTMSESLTQGSPWSLQKLKFTASSASETLAFLVHDIGTPAASVSQFAALSGVCVQAIPEPAALGILGVGLLGLFATRLRQRA